MASIRIDHENRLIWYSKDSSKWEIQVNEHSSITDDNLRDYIYINGELVDSKIYYQYIIIPTQMISDLTGMIGYVEDVCPELAFNVTIEKIKIITRKNEEKEVKSKVLNMTPCKIINWEEGDQELLQGIIDNWNQKDPNRPIDFLCKFDSENDLKMFVESQQ